MRYLDAFHHLAAFEAALQLDGDGLTWCCSAEPFTSARTGALVCGSCGREAGLS